MAEFRPRQLVVRGAATRESIRHGGDSRPHRRPIFDKVTYGQERALGPATLSPAGTCPLDHPTFVHGLESNEPEAGWVRIPSSVGADCVNQPGAPARQRLLLCLETSRRSGFTRGTSPDAIKTPVLRDDMILVRRHWPVSGRARHYCYSLCHVSGVLRPPLFSLSAKFSWATGTTLAPLRPPDPAVPVNRERPEV